MTLVAPSMSSHHSSVTYPHAASYHTHYHQPTAQPVATPMSIKLTPMAPLSHAHPNAVVSGRTESPTTPPSIGPGRYIGIIKTFYPERGYGWMACSRAGRDVFVHANDLQTPEARNLLPFLPGTTLEFDIAQRPRGLSAVNVNVLSVPQPVQSVPEGQLENMRNRRHRTAADNFVPSRPIAMGRRFQGTVVYYTSCKGYGFVQTNNLAGKVYVHIYAVEKFNVTELRIGMVLEFSVRENHKGKYACNVKLLRDVPAEDCEIKAPVVAVTMWEGRYRGILKSFDTKRSLGWIQYRNTEVFMHIYEIRQDNAEDRLHLGVELEFNIGTHGRGPTAYDIDIIGTPSAATLRSIPLATLAIIPVGGMGDSPQGSDDEERNTPPPEMYLGGPYSNHTSRSKLTYEGRPAVSFQTVALLASLLEAAGIDTVRDDDSVYPSQGRQSVPRGPRNSVTEDAQLAELLRICMSSEPDSEAEDEGLRSMIEQMVRARLSQ